MCACVYNAIALRTYVANAEIEGWGSADSRMDDCYEPSSLISWMHDEIPFINSGFNNSGENAEALLDNLDKGIGDYHDYFVVRERERECLI